MISIIIVIKIIITMHVLIEYETYARGTQREYSSNIALLNIVFER